MGGRGREMGECEGRSGGVEREGVGKEDGKGRNRVASEWKGVG